MNYFDAQTQSQELQERLASHTGLVVACYCAAWCDTCKNYQPGFHALAGRMPQALFVWIDIEEDEHLLDDEEVENFPTLLVQGPDGNLFFGPMLPHLEHLERLLQSLEASPVTVQEGPASLRALLRQG